MDSTEQDLAYWRKRMAFEGAAAKAATDERVRRIHEVMAARYRAWIDAASSVESRAA